MSRELPKNNEGTLSHGRGGGDRIEPRRREEQQEFVELIEKRALSKVNLIERVLDARNLINAAKQVKKNRGSPGVDGMETKALMEWLQRNLIGLQEQIRLGEYEPSEIRGVEIPKADGGKRQLGIPTVKDRLVQQAILQVLDPILDPTFSENSYGFRKRRSAHQAIKQASEYVREGRSIVVDMDLTKYFDRVNHDILMGRLERRVEDRKVLKLIRQFLRAGMLNNGVKVKREEGTPQGGSLSPLLANLLLDDLDKELERRGHKFCRYADDFNIYVRSQKAGERVKESISKYLKKKLKLEVNEQKSKVGAVWERKFLGYRLMENGRITVSPSSEEKLKQKIRKLTSRKRSQVKMETLIRELNSYVGGWIGYYRVAKAYKMLEQVGRWMRRRLRSLKLKRLKRSYATAQFLMRQGVNERSAWKVAKSGKGVWRLSMTTQSHYAMGNKWFKTQGLIDPLERFISLNY